MSANEPQTPEAMSQHLSPDARALLAELQGGASASPRSATNQQLADAFNGPVAPQTAMPDAPIVLTPPHDDAKAAAFADMLVHLDDEVSSSPQAVAAAEKFSAERLRTGTAMTPMASEMDEDGDAPPDDAATGDGVILEEEIDGDALDAGPEGGLEDAFDDGFDEDMDFELDERPGGLKGFFLSLGGKGSRAAKRLVGVKDASAAYNAQSGSSLLPFTIIRAVVLVLVAAVPPLVNLAIIQPQISDNNRKITETLSLQAKSTEDEKIADKLAGSVKNVERRSQKLMGDLMPEAELQDLVTKYVAALQRYGVELSSYNVSSDATRKVVIGDVVQDAIIVELDLISRYDVYSEIRNVFVQETKKISVIDEALTTQPGSVDLRVESRVMVPVRRAYDDELDKAQEDGS